MCRYCSFENGYSNTLFETEEFKVELQYIALPGYDDSKEYPFLHVQSFLNYHYNFPVGYCLRCGRKLDPKEIEDGEKDS